MIPLTDEENKCYKKQKKIKNSKKDLVLIMSVKNITKLEMIVITQENMEELLMIFVI